MQRQSFVEQVPFLGAAHAVQTTDVESFARVASELTRIKRCKVSRRGAAVKHVTAVTKMGKLSFIATKGTAIDLESDTCSDVAFLIPYDMRASLTINYQTFSIGNKESILYLPSLPWQMKIHSASLACLVVSVHLETLKGAAATNRGGKPLNPTELNQLLEPTLLSKPSSHGAGLLDSTYTLLRYVDEVVGLAERLPSSLGLDELLLRQLIHLLLPMVDAIEDMAESVLDLEQLVDWIKDHCLEPITLADLETLSGYSRRNLQRAFQKRFGCGPMQWLRTQRMKMARRLLETAPIGSRVKDIAMDCGYTSLSAFSRDYNQEFGSTPKEHWHGAPSREWHRARRAP
jgi:AraC-like DNA-binding protein